jgi:ActR/RegA family two-component response regulator
MPHIQMNRNENDQSILIVDDDEIILDILSKGFEMYGLNVVKA